MGIRSKEVPIMETHIVLSRRWWALATVSAVGFMLGGWLIALNLAGLGWRSVFFVNVPIGIDIALAAVWLMPALPRAVGLQLDLKGAVVLSWDCWVCLCR
jgi:MFS family permease